MAEVMRLYHLDPDFAEMVQKQDKRAWELARLRIYVRNFQLVTPEGSYPGDPDAEPQHSAEVVNLDEYRELNF